MPRAGERGLYREIVLHYILNVRRYDPKLTVTRNPLPFSGGASCREAA